MILTLLSHQWKAFWRSRSAGKNLAVQLFMGFIILYLLACALVLGFALPHLLKEIFPGKDVIPVYCSFILYYFSFDVLMRFMMQELPVLSIQPYLTQHIRRSQLMAFLNIRSLFHFLNLLPLLIFLPFTFSNIAPVRGVPAACAFALAIVFLILFNNFLLLYVKRRTVISSWWLVGFFGVIALLITGDYFQLISLRQYSARVFLGLLRMPWLTLVPAALAVLAYFNNYLFLLHKLYLEDAGKKESSATSREYAWLQQWGVTGELIALNIKLILRNKRPKYLMRLCVILLFYGFVFYTKGNMREHHMTMVLFGALFVTGAFIMQYGNFLFAWHSGYFQGLMSSNFTIPIFVRAQLLMFMAAGTLSFILSSFYGFISWKILPIEIAAWLYNIGISSVLTIFFASFNYKPIDLGKGAAFNYQGTGMAQWIYAILILVVPMLIFVPLDRHFGLWTASITLGVIGLLGILLHSWWIAILSRLFARRKYLILEGFREH